MKATEKGTLVVANFPGGPGSGRASQCHQCIASDDLCTQSTTLHGRWVVPACSEGIGFQGCCCRSLHGNDCRAGGIWHDDGALTTQTT